MGSNSLIVSLAAICGGIALVWYHVRPVLVWIRKGRPGVRDQAKFKRKFFYEILFLLAIVVFANYVGFSVGKSLSISFIVLTMVFLIIASVFAYFYTKASLALKDV